MARNADSINPLCQASAGEFHSGLQTEISRETQPRPDESEGDADGMQSQIQAQPGACAAILALADDTRITASEYRVFALIGRGYQKRADIAAIMKKTVVTVARAISKLVSLGLVEREVVPGKASKLCISGRIIDAARIIQDTPTRITVATSITKDTATRITDDTAHADDTGQAVDKPAAACIGTGARAETLNLNTSTDQIRSDQIATKAMIEALIGRAGAAADPAASGLRHGADLNRYLRGGCDWESDIEPAVDKIAASFGAQGKRFRTWALLEEHVIDFRNRRLAGLPPPAPPVAFVRRQAVSHNGGYRSNGIRPMVATG